MADTTAKTAGSTAPAASEKSGYDVRVEDAGPARKRLTITVRPDVLDEKLDESMGTLASQAVLPGFRKGRAPMALLERTGLAAHFDVTQALYEALGDAAYAPARRARAAKQRG